MVTLFVFYNQDGSTFDVIPVESVAQIYGALMYLTDRPYLGKRLSVRVEDWR